MYLRLAFHFLLALFLSIFQLTFIQPLFSWAGHFNLVLVVLVFVLALSGFDKALIWALTLGFGYDIYNFLPFGFFMICFLVTVIIAEFLLRNFFTDKSLYSLLALTFFVAFVFEFLFYSGTYVVSWYSRDIALFLIQKEFWLMFFQGVLWNSVAAFVFFYFFNFVSNRLNAVFLKH
ncbi:MAG TPA: hypothetical protein VKO42_05165 [Patescibacteria group bacterium]|nr:hypothetical protein [Patescibacteria group bacterium]